MRTAIRLVVMAMLGLVTTESRAQDSRTTWTLGAVLREANQFSRVVDGVEQEDRILDSANLSVGVSTRTERSQLGLFGRFGGNFPRKGPGRDRTNFGGGFSWGYQPSDRFQSTLTQNVSRGFRLQTLSEIGVLEPELESLSSRSSWGLQYRTSPRTTIASSLGYFYTRLESDDEIDGSQIVLDDPLSDDLFTPLDAEPAPTGGPDVPDAEDDVLEILASEGLSFRQTTNQSARASFGVATRTSERTSLGFDLVGGYRRIDSSSFGIRQGAESGGRLWARRSVEAAASLLGSYAFRQSLALEPTTRIQTLMGGISYSPSGRSISLTFQGGASYFQTDDGHDSLTPVVTASFSAAVTRSTSLFAAYRRQFRQSLGFGRTLLIDFANVGVSQEVGSRVTLRALAGASLGTDPLVEDSRLDSFRAGGTLTVRISELLSAGTSFFAMETDQAREATSRESSRNLWNVFLNFSKSWN